MLKKFFDTFHKVEDVYAKFEQLQTYNAQFGHTDSFLSVLPLAYQELSVQQTVPIDSRLVILAGGFLSHRYPHLKDHFLTEKFKEDQAHMHSIIEEMSAFSKNKDGAYHG